MVGTYYITEYGDVVTPEHEQCIAKLVVTKTKASLYSYSSMSKGLAIRPILDKKNGYYMYIFLKPPVDPSKGHTRTKGYVHALVARAVLGPKPDGYRHSFIDGNKKNYHPSNLKYIPEDREWLPMLEFTHAQRKAYAKVEQNIAKQVAAKEENTKTYQVSNSVTLSVWTTSHGDRYEANHPEQGNLPIQKSSIGTLYYFVKDDVTGYTKRYDVLKELAMH